MGTCVVQCMYSQQGACVRVSKLVNTLGLIWFGLYCPQDREANLESILSQDRKANHARTHYFNDRHGQVARNTLITSVVGSEK